MDQWVNGVHLSLCAENDRCSAPGHIAVLFHIFSICCPIRCEHISVEAPSILNPRNPHLEMTGWNPSWHGLDTMASVSSIRHVIQLDRKSPATSSMGFDLFGRLIFPFSNKRPSLLPQAERGIAARLFPMIDAFRILTSGWEDPTPPRDEALPPHVRWGSSSTLREDSVKQSVNGGVEFQRRTCQAGRA